MSYAFNFPITNIIRQLGPVEKYFHCANQLYGSFQVAALYKLSYPITLATLEQCAQVLKRRHKILQADVHGFWKSKEDYYYYQADHLKLNVQQSMHPHDPLHLMHEAIADKEDSLKELAKTKQLYSMQPPTNEFLPWTLKLSHSGDHVVFCAPHTIVDGTSLQIIGSDIVHFLNGTLTSECDTIPLSKSVEDSIDPFPFTYRVGAYLKLWKLFFGKEVDFGKNENSQQDFDMRKPILKIADVTMEQVSSFYKKCKDNGVSLNSGMVSAFYEAVAKVGAVKKTGKDLTVCVPIDMRRRVKQGADLNRNTVGLFVGAINFSEKAEANNWERRAKSIQHKVHSEQARKLLADSRLPMELSAEYSEVMFPGHVEGKDLGRVAPLGLSNLGRSSLIDEANTAYATKKNGIQIEKFWFDESGCGIGFLISIHLATVGNNVAWTVGSFEPFVSTSDLTAVSDEFEKIITCE